MNMDSGKRRNLICFICCKRVNHEDSEQLEPSSSSKIYLKFVEFAHRYLQLEINEGGGNLDDDDSTKVKVFCECCVAKVKQIFGLYEQLCEVELQLSSKLGEMGKFMKESAGHAAGVKGKPGIRELITSKCLEKEEKILKATGSDGRESKMNPGEEFLASEDDDDDVGIDIDVKTEGDDSTDEKIEEIHNADEEEVEVEGEELISTEQIDDPLSLPLVPSASCKSKDGILSDEDSNSSYVPDSQSDWDDSDTTDDDTKHRRISKRKRIDLSDVLKAMTTKVTQENELLQSQAPDPLQVEIKDEDKVDCSPATSGLSADEDDNETETFSSDNFACDHCYRYFHTAQATYTHLLWHEKQSKQEGTPCPFCYKKFVLIQSHQLHMQVHHPSLVDTDKPFNCDEKGCVSSFKTILELNEHMENHSKAIFHCSICQWGFVDAHHVKVHEIIHIEPDNGVYRCTACKFAFQRVKELQIHFDFKHGPSISLQLVNIGEVKPELGKRYKCPYCQAGFPKKDDLTLHSKQCAKNPDNIQRRTTSAKITKNKTRKRIVRCHQCGIWISHISQKNHMAMHLQKEKMKKKREEEKRSDLKSESSSDEDEDNQFVTKSSIKLTCDERQGRSGQASPLHTHLKSHDKQSEIQGKPCCFCSRTSVLPQAQQLHMQMKHPSIISTKKPFKCDETGCEFSFKTLPELNEHVSIHSKPILECSVCQWSFVNEDRLKLHELLHIHPNRGKYHCPACEVISRTRKHLQIHFDNKHGANLGVEFYKCSKPNCTQTFRSKAGLKTHMKTHEKKSDPKKCPHCKKVFRTAEEVITHLKKCTMNPDNYIYITTSGGKSAKKIRCVTCELFVFQSSMRRHVLTHMTREERQRHKREKVKKNPRPICESCGLSFSTSQCLKYHVNLIHKKIIPRVKCQFCEKSFQRNCELNRHVESVHEGVDSKTICDVCGKVFANKSCLRAHERYHKDEKRCACHCCDKRFHLRGDLRKHLRRIHGKTKGQEFTPGEGIVLKSACRFPSCGAKFGSDAELQRHVEGNHASVTESMFVCNLCGNVFSTQSSLTQHNRIHSKDNVHECHLCGKTYKYKASVKQHLQVVHDVGRGMEYFKCEYPNCEAKFKIRKYLNRHILNVHRKGKRVSNLKNETVNPN